MEATFSRWWGLCALRTRVVIPVLSIQQTCREKLMACGGDSYCHVSANGVCVCVCFGSHATRNMPRMCHVVAIPTVMFSRRVCLLEATLTGTCRKSGGMQWRFILSCFRAMGVCLCFGSQVTRNMPREAGGMWWRLILSCFRKWCVFCKSSYQKDDERSLWHVVSSIHTVIWSRMGCC